MTEYSVIKLDFTLERRLGGNGYQKSVVRRTWKRKNKFSNTILSRIKQSLELLSQGLEYSIQLEYSLCGHFLNLPLGS